MNSESPRSKRPAPADAPPDTVLPSDSQPVVLPSAADATRIGAPSSGTAVLHLIGGYSVIKKIGEGGMGAVYLAEDPKLGRKVAIKTMKPELAADKANRDRFEREARAAAAVEHENIVPIWGVGEAADSSPFIAMPFLQGEMLADRLRRQPVSGLSVILKVAREVADGLAAAHAKGLIHRDIKPGNIWLEGDLSARETAQQIRRCKILDFGLARSLANDDAHLTASGAVLGTPAFMAPEQARGLDIDGRTDLFSLGVTLYRMATGKMPFAGPNSTAVLIALATETPAPVWSLNPNLPPALAELIDKLLCKDPAGRPQTAAAVSAAVKQIIRDIQGKHPPSGAVAPAAPPPAPEPVMEVVTEPEVVVAKVVAPPKPKPEPEPEPAAPPSRAPEPRPKAKKKKARKSARRDRTPWYIAGGVLALCAIIALAVVILRLQTGEGTFVVEIDDPNVEARIKDGKLVLVGPDGKERYTITAAERNTKIAAGPYKVRVEGADGLVLDTTEFTMKKGDKVTVRVTLDPKVAPRWPDPPKPPANSPAAERKAAEWVLSVGGRVQVDHTRPVGAAAELPKEPFRLTFTDLSECKQVTDAGMAAFAGTGHLTALSLTELPQLTEAGIAHLKGCNDLEFLAIGTVGGAQKFGDSGLKLFDDCTNLRTIWLGGTQVTDAGIATMKGRVELQDLRLGHTPVTDAGLAHLKGCAELHFLYLKGTKVTAKGVADFARAVPRCKVEWDGGTVEPDLRADRKAAEFALSTGSTVCIDWEQTKIATVKGLPDRPFRLTAAHMGGNRQVTDATIALFKDCKNLKDLDLAYTGVTDTGLARLKGLRQLTNFNCGSTPVTDAGLANLNGCKDLRNLAAADTKLTDAGLAQFKDRKNLMLLWLGHNQLTDAGLAHLAGLERLIVVDVKETKVTAKGVAELAKARPKCRIIWDGGEIEPASK